MNILGETINGYKFNEFINKGGFGAVYKVEKDGNIFAIKVFNEEYVLDEFRNNEDNKNRLIREIDIMKSLSNPLLVKYVDDFNIDSETGKSFFLVMEYIDGINLRGLLKEKKILSEADSIHIFRQILDGLTYLHSIRGDDETHGIIHRDLKPENILIQKDNTIKIVDFGISKVIDYTSLTNTGEVFGTGPYMSPEQVKDSKNIDKRSDLYTAGVILYEMLTGVLPFESKNIVSLLNKIKNDKPAPPRIHNRAITNKLENIIINLLNKNPYQRYLNANDVLIAINNTTNDIDQERTYDLSPNFYLRLYNDKTVLEEFSNRTNDFINVIFPANLENVPTCKGLLKNIQENDNIKVFVDPATVRLAYSAYKETKGVGELPYAPDDYKIITPNYLSELNQKQEYVKKVIEKQIDLKANILLTPFHYIHNSSIGYGPNRNLTAEWFDLDCKLTQESLDYRDTHHPDKPLYMGLCIRADSLHDESTKSYLLNTFSGFNVDGYLIYADGIDLKTDETTLYHYIDFLIELQKGSRKPVIAGRISPGFGLGLLSIGLSGFTSGTARFESFYEDLYSESGKSYNMYSRYYFPELLKTVPINRKVPTKFTQINNYLETCSCYYCDEKENHEIIKDKNAHLHFLEIMYNEIKNIKAMSNKESIDSYLEKLQNAKNAYSQIVGVFKRDDISYITKRFNVFNKISEKHYV